MDDEDPHSGGSWLTMTALWGSFLGLFLIPFAFFTFGSFLSGDRLFILLAGLVAVCVLLLLAVAGLSNEIDAVREDLRHLRREAASSVPERAAATDT